VHETPVFKPDHQEQGHTEVPEMAEEVREERPAGDHAGDSAMTNEGLALEPDAALEESSAIAEPPVEVATEMPANEAHVEAPSDLAGNEVLMDGEKTRRRPRKPDPQASLPF
jgi:hypothetical protein